MNAAVLDTAGTFSPGCNPGVRSASVSRSLAAHLLDHSIRADVDDPFFSQRTPVMSAKTPENPAITPDDSDFTREILLAELRRIIVEVRDAQPGEYKKDRLRAAAPLLGLTFERAQNLLDGSACMSPGEEALTVLARYARFTTRMENILESKLEICRARNRLLGDAQRAADPAGPGLFRRGDWRLGIGIGRLGRGNPKQATETGSEPTR
jgi:hypothetical protein